MHSIHRELDIKHKRLQSDMATAESVIAQNELKIRDQGIKII